MTTQTSPDYPPDVEAKKRIEDWLTGEGRLRKATINDVARIAAVSKKTVSRVINASPLVKDRTRRDVNAVIEALGYEPDPQARGLAFRQSFLVGMIYDNPNPRYVVNIQQGILDGLRGTGYELVVHPCDRASPRFLETARSFVERQKLFGVILTPSVSEDERLADILRRIGCAYVRIASVKLDEDQHMLVSNDRLGAIAAGRHLAELGHRQVAHITGRAGFRSSLERREGFEEGLAQFGIKLDPGYVAEGDYTFDSGLRYATELLHLYPRPTGIFAANDEMAAGVLQAIRMAGMRCPEDVSVIGYDDFQLAVSLWPRLTTIHSPSQDFAFHAARRLLGKDNSEAISRPLAPWLVVRESTGPAPTQ